MTIVSEKVISGGQPRLSRAPTGGAAANRKRDMTGTQSRKLLGAVSSRQAQAQDPKCQATWGYDNESAREDFEEF
jgi:hypothetical protein